jgi:hypothetical protein
MITVMGATGHSGKIHSGTAQSEREGPRDLSCAEATHILGQRIGKPDLQYVQVSYDDETKALVQAGLPESFANLYVEMTRAFNDGIIQPLQIAGNTTPTRSEDFVGELSRAYQQEA